MPKPKHITARDWCDQCVGLNINGHNCHETGCPNEKKIRINGQWVKVFECYICGSKVIEGDSCDCQEPEIGLDDRL